MNEEDTNTNRREDESEAGYGGQIKPLQNDQTTNPYATAGAGYGNPIKQPDPLREFANEVLRDAGKSVGTTVSESDNQDIRFDRSEDGGSEIFEENPPRREFHPLVEEITRFPSLYVYLFQEDDITKMSVSSGTVRYQHIIKTGDAGGPAHYKTPTLNGISIDESEPPDINASVGFVYVNVTTDEYGVPNEDSIISIKSAEQVSTHHRRFDPANPGRNGDYWFLIGEIQEIENELVVTRRYTGNINLPNQLIENENVGGFFGLYKDYNESTDKHRWKTVTARYGANVSDANDVLTWDFDAESVGGAGEDVLVAPPNPLNEETAKFRSISQRPSSPQVHVGQGAVVGGFTAIQIEGNGFGTAAAPEESIVNGTVVASFIDGLCVSVGEVTITGSGDTFVGRYGIGITDNGAGTFTWDFDPESVGGGTGVDVLVTPPNPLANEEAKFRRITERASGTQIHIVEGPADVNGDTPIEVQGNNLNGSVTINSESFATYEDGLWTDFTTITVRGLTSAEATGEGMTTPQITVSTTAGDPIDIVVRGNTNTDVVWIDGVGVVTFEDGLIADWQDMTLTAGYGLAKTTTAPAAAPTDKSFKFDAENLGSGTEVYLALAPGADPADSDKAQFRTVLDNDKSATGTLEELQSKWAVEAGGEAKITVEAQVAKILCKGVDTGDRVLVPFGQGDIEVDCDYQATP